MTELRGNVDGNWPLIITNGELTNPNPYKAKLFPPVFITARTLVHSTGGLP